MPSTLRRPSASLIKQLESQPYRFEFFQAVRLLLAHQRCHSGQGDGPILEQAIRFRNSISLGFPPSEIESLELEWVHTSKDTDDPSPQIKRESMPLPAKGQHPALDGAARRGLPEKKGVFRKATLTPAFMGLTGPSGVLPRHYTQHVADRVLRHRDTTMRAFLDIFASRAVSLFYQSWMKYRLHLQYEADRKNRFVPLVLSLAGLGSASMRDRLADGGQGIADEALAYYVAALRERPKSAQWFARVVEDFFHLPAKTTEYVGHWMAFPAEDRTCIGIRHAVLGKSALCGARIWDRQSRIRLTLGPMRKARFLEMLPGSPGHRNLMHLFRLMQGLAYDCEVRLILDRRDISCSRLQGHGGQVRLGWTSWMKAPETASNAADAAYILSAEQGID